ncbi:MAG TPA: hypothetical protein VJJ83_05315 [Candidatus Babeliales bacterium]|nr:hypothetical protein [Candidatus Babeliales bacterium]
MLNWRCGLVLLAVSFRVSSAELAVDIAPNSTINDPPAQYYCTAADSKFFEKVVQLVQGINQHNGEQVAKILVFDLGFTKAQRQALAQLPKVALRQITNPHPAVLTMFKTGLIKPGLNRYVRGWFMWKPLVLKQALDECPYIFYIDSAIEIYGPLTNLFRHIIQQGYFLVACDCSSVQERVTHYVKTHLINKLDPTYKELFLTGDCGLLSAGVQGLSRQYLEQYLLPVVALTQEPKFFADDGTAQLGFGAGRHDQVLFSIYAHLNRMQIHQSGWMDLELGGGQRAKMHAHWHRKELHSQSAFKY